jgi:putative tributyrin esterase
LLVACHEGLETQRDVPRLTPKVTLRDVKFHSAALSRDMEYRAIFPRDAIADEKLQAIYLLHGGGGGFRDWSNYSNVAQYAEHGLVLIMPEGDSSYFVNEAESPQDRYEDYIVSDLISDVERRFPVGPGRINRAIVGVSMGGFGAINLALRHPDLFEFAGGISPAIDVPGRPFSIKRISQWRRFRKIFGPWQGQFQKENDPFLLVRSTDQTRAPYLFLACGDQEGLLPANGEFAKLLEERRIKYEFHVVPGRHDWNQWNRQIPSLFSSLSKHFEVERQVN